MDGVTLEGWREVFVAGEAVVVGALVLFEVFAGRVVVGALVLFEVFAAGRVVVVVAGLAVVVLLELLEVVA